MKAKKGFLSILGVLLLGLTSCSYPAITAYRPVMVKPVLPVKTVINPLEERFRRAGLIEIPVNEHGIAVQLAYADTLNFLSTNLYGHLTKVWLHPLAAEKLLLAANKLAVKAPGYAILVYDAARPVEVQELMWHLLDLPYAQKRRFLNPPGVTSLHNFGAAVDVTLLLPDGQPADMGTSYDDPGELAYPIYEKQFLSSGLLTPQQVNHRTLLRSVMLEAGFTAIESEWWHFNACSRAYAEAHLSLVP